MEDLLVTLMAIIFVGICIVTITPLLWAESPIMFITCVVGGLIMSWLNGDWD